MSAALGLALAAIFASLSLLHAYWACGGRALKGAAVPEVEGAPAFKPSAGATWLVAVALLGAGVLLALLGGVVEAGVTRSLLVWPSGALAAVLLARAIGDRRLVGFFKRPSTSRFARLDSQLYSPLCLVLALAIGLLIWSTGA
jgi:hypothetical protein